MNVKQILETAKTNNWAEQIADMFMSPNVDASITYKQMLDKWSYKF